MLHGPEWQCRPEAAVPVAAQTGACGELESSGLI